MPAASNRYPYGERDPVHPLGNRRPPLRPRLERLHETSHRAAALLAQVLGRQTAVIGMLDAFKLFGLSLLITLPLLLLVKEKRGRAAPVDAPAD